jgi:hypothetical protein
MAAVLSINTTTKRRSAEAGGGALVMRRDRGGTRWEDFFLSFGVANRATKKAERGIRHQRQAAAISRNNTTTNRKQYQMGRGTRFGRGGTFGKDRFISFRQIIAIIWQGCSVRGSICICEFCICSTNKVPGGSICVDI